MRGLFGACNVRRAHQCLTPCVAPAGHLYGHNSYFITIVFFWKFSWSNARWVLFHKWMSIGRWWSRPHLEPDTHQSSLRQHLHMITVWQVTIIEPCAVSHTKSYSYSNISIQYKSIQNIQKSQTIELMTIKNIRCRDRLELGRYMVSFWWSIL